MIRSLGFIVSLLIGLSLSLPLNGAEQRRNVLFLISDDLNNLLGCYGDPLAKTPHLDKLAARGVRFDRAYCAFPLCGPSRNSMLTGLYPNSTGIFQNAQIFRQTIPHHHSLPHAFRLAGYHAARIGKLYHYGVPRSIGTNGHDDPGSWEIEINPPGVDRMEELKVATTLRPNEFGGTPSWYASPKPDDQHTDGLNALEAEWMLERYAKHSERPFFLAVGFFRPHTPYIAPQRYFDLFPREQMSVPSLEEIIEDQKDIPAAALASYRALPVKFTVELQHEALQAYYASISFMDAQVGKVVDALDRLGLADNTVIVFTSDHGYHNGQHGLWQKMSLFEESSRVPLLIAAPGLSQNAVAPAPVSHVDLYPTLAEICNVTPPSNLQGQSLVPLLKDPQAPGRGWALTQVTRRREAGNNQAASGEREYFGYSLRTPRYRYTEWDSGREGRELYDHEQDPRELTNLANLPEHATVVAELSQQVQTAVAASLPPDGKSPEINPGLWMPNLTDP